VVRHEEIARVEAGVRVTFETLAESGPLEPYTLFVLSDSTDPGIARAEEHAVRALIRHLGAAGRIVYRRRATNEGRKSGNLADFCARWGAQFDYMVVLDADSLLAGRTIRELVRRMDAAPRAGILQVPARPVNRESLFGRIQQFAAEVYGPLVVGGLDFWLGKAAPYRGHNAIIRLAPFMQHCRLPRLPGRAPFGGEILSHDFVEGALMRRAGWEVRLATDLDGSYEEVPANVIAHAARDRRWCEGNLQHLRLVALPGLTIASRLTFVVGALAYLCAPAWALLVLILSLRVRPSSERALEFEPVGPEWFLQVLLLAAVLSFLFVPKILALVSLASRPGRIRSLGGVRAVLVSVVGESVFSVLFTPIQLILHTQFVLAILLGRSVEWTAQPRRDATTSLPDAIRVHGTHTALAGLVGVLAYAADPTLCLWLSPAIAGLGLSIPISMLSSHTRWGRRARQLGFFQISEEIAPPRLLRALTAKGTVRARVSEPSDTFDLSEGRLTA
jgi:membrane glycosyltransferase